MATKDDAANKTPPPPPKQIPDYLIKYGAAKIAKAQTAFGALVADFAGANIIQQITTAGKTNLIGNALRDVMYWGQTGSLWECYKAVEEVEITPEMAPFLTEDVRQQFKNRLIEILASL